MAKIYTKTGDDGTTGLFGGPRVSKSDVRIEAYGSVDELNSVLGVVVSGVSDSDATTRLPQLLLEVQSDLFAIGAELASPNAAAAGTKWEGSRRVAALESAIDGYQQDLPPLKSFILPGGAPLAAQLHLARTVCRRAERRIVTLDESLVEPHEHILCYLNRLSDLLFVLARATNFESEQPEIPWQASP